MIQPIFLEPRSLPVPSRNEEFTAAPAIRSVAVKIVVREGTSITSFHSITSPRSKNLASATVLAKLRIHANDQNALEIESTAEPNAECKKQQPRIGGQCVEADDPVLRPWFPKDTERGAGHGKVQQDLRRRDRPSKHCAHAKTPAAIVRAPLNGANLSGLVDQIKDMDVKVPLASLKFTHKVPGVDVMMQASVNKP